MIPGGGGDPEIPDHVVVFGAIKVSDLLPGYTFCTMHLDRYKTMHLDLANNLTTEHHTDDDIPVLVARRLEIAAGTDVPDTTSVRVDAVSVVH
jgi:hypothetical protein